jgi:hypothetical protein
MRPSPLFHHTYLKEFVAAGSSESSPAVSDCGEAFTTDNTVIAAQIKLKPT